MEEDCDVTLDFNLEHDYNEFINCLRRKLADHPKRESDIELHKIDFTDNHLLPERKTLGPARWIYINLSVGVSENNKRETTLAIRDDTVWFVGFRNQKREWYEFGWGEITFIEQSIPLRCGSGYAELLGRSELMDLELGKCFVSNAVCTLSKYGRSTPNNSKQQRSAKVCLGKLIVMFCESARLCSYLETVKNCWVKSEKLTNFNQINYVKNWRTMSRAMMGWGHYTKGLKAIGIQGHKEARKEVHLILNSRPPEVKKMPGEEGQDKKPPGGGSNPQDSTEGQDRENGNNGGDHLSQPPDSNGTSQGDHNASPSNNGGRNQHAEHGRILMEVFKLGATASVDADPEDFVSKIAIFDGKLGQLIYKHEENRDAPSSSNDIKDDLVLVGPYRAISASGNVGLKITGTSSQDVLIWDPCTRTEHQCDKLLTKNIPGGLKLTYAVLSSAVEVSVQIDVFLFGNTTGTIAVYGKITAHSNFFRKEEANVLLFRCGIDDKVELSRSSAGSTIPLIRSVVAWCIGSQLIINVDNLHFVTTPINEGMSPTAKSLEFSFDDDTAKVRFQILEGIGYVRISLDDTREYRDKPGNSLPRSLTNEVIKMDEDMSRGTELLDVHSGQFSLTFEPNKLIHWLLHLINKSNHSYVAFRCPGGQGISKLSGILPPDSTSTYLATLERELPLNVDVFSLTLENCVVPEEEGEDVTNDEDMEDLEDVEDVDEIFDVQARSEIIEKVTFEVIVRRAADTCEPIQPEIKIGPTVIVQTIPDAGEGPSPSKDREEKTPMVHMQPESSHLPVHGERGRGCASSTEFATGAMSSLLPKLGDMLLEEYNLQKRLKMGIKDLRDELLIIEAALVKVSDVPLDQLDPLVKIWANDARELSYVIEDSLDSFMVSVEGFEPTKPQTFSEFIKKTCRKATKLNLRREIANDIKDVKIQVKEVKERYDRYRDIIGNTTAKTEVDPRLLSMYKKVSDLVGIDKAMDELMKVLSDQSDVSENKLKTVSIVGFGGLGKTTLAKQVYDKLNRKFDCAGFVPVGRNPDIKKVLKDILLEFDLEMYNSALTMDERQLINHLRKFLTNKRYLIVIDDIWDTPTWEMIKCALLDGDSGSRIIATTRISEVAENVGGVYNIKPLSDDNSQKLFYTRICGGEGTSFDIQSAEVSDKILKKCGGVPLSIITIASLLVGKRREDWSKVYESIGFGHEDSEVVKNTRKILSFSFYDLPAYLKNCLLHLSMFREDSLISKHSLIWIWIAEGFVPCEPGLRLFEVGESYFNQLVNRSMIQLVESSPGRNLVGCRVHDMVHDSIRNLSSELSFVTIYDIEQEQSTCSRRRTRSTRRLSVHQRSAEHNLVSMEMEHVRSFHASLCTDSRLLQLLSFKLLRVLVLHSCNFDAEGCGLEHLGKLVQLRYLGLIWTPVRELPRNIGHELKFLQTLDLIGSGITELPPSLGELSKLMCLRTHKGTRMMGRIGKLTTLEELQLHSVDKCPNFVTELGMLREVAVLKIYFDEMDKSVYKALMESVRNMRNIESLEIWSHANEIVRVGSWEDWVPPSNFRELSLWSIFLSRLPSWINFPCVPHLSYLYLEVEVVEVQDLQILGRLPLLRYLALLNENEDCLPYTVGSDEFESLRYFTILTEILCGGEGALPMLEKLECNATVGKDVSLVQGNMPLIQNVKYYLDCTNCSGEQVEEAEAALRLAAKSHPNRPTLEIIRENYEEVSSSDNKQKEESDRRAAASWDMLVELGRTVVVLTTRQSNGRSQDIQDYISGMFSSVLNNPVIHDLLLNLGSQSGLEVSLDCWRRATEICSQECMNEMLDEVGKSDSSGDYLSEIMQQMMPVVSQVLAELPPFEYTLRPQYNDDGQLGGELDSSLQTENDGADMIVATNEEAGPSRIP